MKQCTDSDNRKLDIPLPPPTSAVSQKRKSKPTGLAWFDEPYSPVRGETALWVAVITQAMMDALNRSGTTEARYHKHEAIRWLTDNGRDFAEVCHLAGLNPSYVRRKAKKALLSPLSWRALPGQGKRYKERKARERRNAVPGSTGGASPPPHVTPHSNVIIGPWCAA